MYLQVEISKLMMIGKVKYKDEILEIQLTPNFQTFQPQYLLYFSNICEINISGCTQIEPTLFVDCIGACNKLLKLEMTGCIQFSEKSLFKIVQQLPLVRYLDCTACVQVTFATAYNVVSALKELIMINLEPKFPLEENQDWKRMIQIFRRVKFGHSIMRIFPHHGLYVRFAENGQSDEE